MGRTTCSFCPLFLLQRVSDWFSPLISDGTSTYEVCIILGLGSQALQKSIVFLLLPGGPGFSHMRLCVQALILNWTTMYVPRQFLRLCVITERIPR